MTFEERKIIMTSYLQLKIFEEDWHGVADAAMDLRNLETEIKSRINVFSENEKSSAKAQAEKK